MCKLIHTSFYIHANFCQRPFWLTWRRLLQRRTDLLSLPSLLSQAHTAHKSNCNQESGRLESEQSRSVTDGVFRSSRGGRELGVLAARGGRDSVSSPTSCNNPKPFNSPFSLVVAENDIPNSRGGQSTVGLHSETGQ